MSVDLVAVYGQDVVRFRRQCEPRVGHASYANMLPRAEDSSSGYIRRNVRRIADALQESNHPTDQGVGAWMQLLIEKMSATGSGYTQRATAKMQSVRRSDPELLGNFRVSITDQNFGQLFRGKAAR